jgi:hypothetical protein
LRNLLSRISKSILFRLGIGFALSAIALYLALRDLDLQSIWNEMRSADLGLVILALGCVLLSQAGKAMRWKVLLGSERGNVSFKTLLLSLTNGQMLNALSPLRLGELSRAHQVGRMGPGRSYVLGTLVVEKTLDLLVFALFFAVLFASIQLPGWVGNSAYVLGGGALLVAGLVIFAAVQRLRLVQGLNRMIWRLPENARLWVSGSLGSGLSGLDVVRQRKDLAVLAAASLLVWCVAALVNYIMLLALDIHLPLYAAFWVLVVLQAGIALPSAPASLGIFEYSCALALSIFEIDRTTAVSYSILLHGIVYLPILLLGLVSFWMLEPGERRGVAKSP